MAKSVASRMSDAAVKKATGKTWAHWFKILDKFPKSKSHTERAQWLWDHHLKKSWRRRESGRPASGSWWCQMVTVTYEQARGLRKKHQVVGGYQISASLTLPIPVSELYGWWTKKRGQWLKTQSVKVTSATRNKYLHMTWPDGTKVDVDFWKKGIRKSLVQVQHRKLKSSAMAQKMKSWWKEQLQLLAEAAQ